MKSSLKQQFMKLQKQKNKSPPINRAEEKQHVIGQKKKGPQKIEENKPARQMRQPRNLFVNMTFCLPHFDIELTRKQAECISRRITSQGGKVIQYVDSLHFQPLQYVLVSPKARLQTIQKKIEQKINYIDILDCNYIQCCIAEGQLIEPYKFSLLNPAGQEKKQTKTASSSHSKKRKLQQQHDPILQETSMVVGERSITQELPSSGEGESQPQQRNYKKPDKDKFFCQTGKQQNKPAMNKFIQEQLLQLQKIYANQRDIGRKIAYGKAASLIRMWKQEIKTEEDVNKIPGIGPKIRQKVKQIVNTGKVKKLQQLNQSEQVVAMRQLSKVWGIGPAKAKQLYVEGINSIQQLRKDQSSLTKNQKVGLKYFQDFEERIPRQKVARMFQQVRKALHSMDRNRQAYRAQVCGSYRRGKATCGDMDVIITRKDGVFQTDLLVKLVAQLQKTGFITDNLSQPKCNQGHVSTSYMGVCRFGDQTHHRIDIKHYPLEEYAFASLYFTGSGMFNRSMRLYATKLGLQLSDKGFARRPHKNGIQWKGNIPACYTEEDVFNVLGLDFKTPKQRDD